MEKINDLFETVGNTLKEFKEKVKEMHDITKVEKFPLTERYSFLSVLSVKGDAVMVCVLNSEFINLFNSGAFFTLNVSEETEDKKWNFIRKIKKSYFDDKFIDENIQVNDLLILNNITNRVTLISDEAYRTMLVRFHLNCDGMITKTLARNVMIAEKLYLYEGMTSTVVTRENSLGYEKVMSVLSDKYAHIPQTILCEVVKELEKAEKVRCTGFAIDNRISQCNLAFTEKEDEVRDVYGIKDAIPGIYLATSDTGDCSITAKAFFKFGSSNVYVGSVTRRHEGNVDKDVLLKDIKNNLFPLYTEVPNKLVSLMAIDIKEPVKAVKKALKSIKLVELIGKKNEMVVSEQLILEVSSAMKYTAYDIAIMVLQLSKRVQNLSDDAKRKLESGVIKVIDCDFTSLAATTPKVTLSN